MRPAVPKRKHRAELMHVFSRDLSPDVFLGYEQANRYRLVNSMGQDVGFLAEQEGGFGRAMGRQLMRGHRRK